jgi:hypothetical protein
MTKIVQEKFQVDYPQQRNDDARSGWITDAEARAKKNLKGREGRPGGDSLSRFSDNSAMFNSLPPGADIEDQEVNDIRRMDIVDGAGHNQVTQDVDARSLRTGFSRKKILSSDDEYTREHNDAFYDTVEVDGVEGYVERNNMLDRM